MTRISWLITLIIPVLTGAISCLRYSIRVEEEIIVASKPKGK